MVAVAVTLTAALASALEEAEARADLATPGITVGNKAEAKVALTHDLE